MPSRSIQRLASLTLSNLLIPIAVLVFATGFFPYKPVLPGLATWEYDRLEGSGFGENANGRVGVGGVDDGGVQDGEVGLEGQIGKAPFDRVVFMVVDALRSDFVYGHGSEMAFTQSLIRSGAAIPFTAHATPPTVTMPRVKALTTGSVPSFLDLLLNFAESDTSSSLASQDTWLAQLRSPNFPRKSGADLSVGAVSKNNTLLFYGDDTWLKLFPSPFFARADGTSSFFVSDFTEVDLNVTRHVPAELQEEDWKAMVLHYLGLDHIGHKTGPRGPAMGWKQGEMDGVVREVYEAIEGREGLGNTLLVVAGDHGMNAGGNHGGSGPGETEPALLFVSPKFRGMMERRTYECPTLPRVGTEFQYYTKVEQSDVVPTLAGLMGFPVPKNSLGVFIPELAGVLDSEEEVLRLLRRNARQMVGILEATFGQDHWRYQVRTYSSFEDVYTGPLDWESMCRRAPTMEGELGCLLAIAQHPPQRGSEAERDSLLTFLHAAQDAMSSTASSYDIPRMVTGMVVAAIALVLAVLSFPSLWPLSLGGSCLALTTSLYGVMMFASSYVEEEQHFWYWLTPAWLAVLALQNFRQGGKLKLSDGVTFPKATFVLPILVLHRVMVRWNQTGQKHTGEPDIVHAFFPKHHLFMWSLVLITYAYVGVKIARFSFADIMTREAAISTATVMLLPAVVFKLNFTQADAPELVLGLAEKLRDFTKDLDLVAQARIVFVVLAIAAACVSVGAPTLAWLRDREGKVDGGPTATLPDRLQPLLTLFLITQTRAPNIPLFLLLEVQHELLALFFAFAQRTANSTSANPSTPSSKTTLLAVTTLLFSQTTYFAFGGSNSISSIDLSNAYNGVADYNVVAVGMLLFASNWAGAVWWLATAVTLLLDRTRGGSGGQGNGQVGGGRKWVEEERAQLSGETAGKLADGAAGSEKPVLEEAAMEGTTWSVYIAAMTVFIAGSLVAVMAACTALRTHLFIWTVFSPKYLYAMAWAVGWHLVINIGLGGLLWWMGVRSR